MLELEIKEKKRTRTPAMIKAQKKYYLKIKNEYPEKYKEQNQKYAKKQYEKNKHQESFMQQNRENVRKYYYDNKALISEKRRQYYKQNRDKILVRQKEARDKKRNINNEENDIKGQ